MRLFLYKENHAIVLIYDFNSFAFGNFSTAANKKLFNNSYF